MENHSLRSITIYTPDKVYSGHIDISNDSLRTIDVFNSSNLYWKDPAERSFEDALLLNNASIVLEGQTKLGQFHKLQVRLADVIFFHDSLKNLGDSMEKKRAAHLKKKTNEKASIVNIITQTEGDSFFFITGSFYGLFKSKAQHRYIPITKANVIKVIRHGEKWLKQEIPIEGGFVGISTNHIEACTFSSK